jgi:threonine dehydrogenase-like Zn-dependent dehydrogenase
MTGNEQATPSTRDTNVGNPDRWLSVVAGSALAAYAKGLTLKTGQTHVQNYTRPLLAKILRGDIDPSVIITHRVTLDEAPEMYRTFRDKEDDCVKVVMRPAA